MAALDVRKVNVEHDDELRDLPIAVEELHPICLYDLDLLQKEVLLDRIFDEAFAPSPKPGSAPE